MENGTRTQRRSSQPMSTGRRWPKIIALLAAAVASQAVLASAEASDRSTTAEYVPAVPAGAWVASDDAYTVSRMPARTTGSSPKVAVGRDGAAYKVGYLRFDVDDVPGRAELALTVTGGQPGTLQIHRTAGDWDEGNLAATSAPEPGDIVASVNLRGGYQRLVIDLGEVITEPGVHAFALTRPEPIGVTRIASHNQRGQLVPHLRPAAGAPEPAQAEPPPPGEPPEPPEPTEPPEPGLPELPERPDLPRPPGSDCTVSEILVPSCGHWFGVGAVPLGDESWYQAIDDFEAAIDRQVDIVHFYRRGQDRVFPTPVELDYVSGDDGDRLLFYNWRPQGLTWRQVADGAADDYLVRLAEHMLDVHPEPFFLSLHAEMESQVDARSGSGQTADDFRDFFRHTVDVLRSNGATQIVTVVNYMGAPHWSDEPWFEDLYPGDDVVDWIAQDPYSFGRPPIFRTDFAGLVNRPHFRSGTTWPGFYTWATTNFPDKPMMLAEWGVDEFDDDPDFKPMFFRSAASQMRAFPAIKALVYWSAPDAPLAGATRVDSSPESLEAVRTFVDHPLLRLAGDVVLRGTDHQGPNPPLQGP